MTSETLVTMSYHDHTITLTRVTWRRLGAVPVKCERRDIDAWMIDDLALVAPFWARMRDSRAAEAAWSVAAPDVDLCTGLHMQQTLRQVIERMDAGAVDAEDAPGQSLAAVAIETVERLQPSSTPHQPCCGLAVALGHVRGCGAA